MKMKAEERQKIEAEELKKYHEKAGSCQVAACRGVGGKLSGCHTLQNHV